MIYILSGRSHFQFKTRTWSMAWTPVIKSHGSSSCLIRTDLSKVLPSPPENKGAAFSPIPRCLWIPGLLIRGTCHRHVVSERFTNPHRRWLRWSATAVRNSVFFNEYLMVIPLLNRNKFVDSWPLQQKEGHVHGFERKLACDKLHIISNR